MGRFLTRRNTILLVAATTLWRVYLSATLQLHPDEAYYWLWSRHLDVSYFDHPPMVAYVIWLGTLFSQAELWVRISGPVFVVAMSCLMWRLAMQLYKSVPLAAGSVMLFNAYPLSMLGMIVMTPDVPVLMFWSLSVCVFWQVLQSQKTWLWVALGVCFGLALLSKYTAILMIPCFFIYLLLTDERKWLKTRYPYLSVLVGLVVFSPVIFWNVQHAGVSFLFQLKNGLSVEPIDLNKVAEYVAGQLLISGPVAWFVGIWAAFAGLYRRDKATLFLICTAAPVILFFGFTSLRKVANPNWPLFAYFSFSVLIAKYCLDGHSRWRRSLWSAALVTSLFLSLVATLQARFGIIPLTRFSEELADADFTNAFYGWRELGVELKQHADQQPVVTPSHQLSAEIIYYTGGSVPAQTAARSRPSQFVLWGQSQDPDRVHGFSVWAEADNLGADGSYYPALSSSRLFQAYRDGRVVRRYHIFEGGKAPAADLKANSRAAESPPKPAADAAVKTQ